MRWRSIAAPTPRLFATALLVLSLSCTSSVATRPHVSVVAAAPAPPLGGAEQPAAAPPPVAGEAQVLADARHLLNRCAFGPRPGEVERVARMGTERWLTEQLQGPPESPLLEAALVPHRAALVPAAQLVDDWLGEGWEAETRTLKELRRETGHRYREHLRRVAMAELTRHILSRRQLEAVLTDFWANHFNIYASKGLVRLYGGDYLERAIRPHALGKFSDLLLATARHPAMLLYLDNAESRRETGSMTEGGKRRGLNENYARELLELHTLGIDGGYSQKDVQEVARVLTGWSVTQLRGGRFEYVFRKRAHDRGEKTLLGEVFPAGRGEDEGIRLLDLLARHPRTARHLATRLCARFVSDEPPESCVAAAADAYRGSDGDIRQVVRAIVGDASFWAPAARRSKLKTPLELVASTARALGALPDGSLALSRTLERLGEPLLQERVPTGYPDSEPEWASGGGMLARMTFATELGAGTLDGLEVPWHETLPETSKPSELTERLAALLLGVGANSELVSAVREETSAIADPQQRRAAVVALLVGSPEFQRQ